MKELEIILEKARRALEDAAGVACADANPDAEEAIQELVDRLEEILTEIRAS